MRRISQLRGCLVFMEAYMIANLDSEGKGPKRMRIGRKVAYLTEDLLEWLAARTTVLA